MHLIFSDMGFPIEIEKSIFLAGPSPRYDVGDTVIIDTWRHQAIKELEALGYDGHVYIPLPFALFDAGIVQDKVDYVNQLEWERKALNRADIIVFDIARTEQTPGFTTNIEFGMYAESGRVLLTYPSDVQHIHYIQKLAERNNIPQYPDSLHDCLKHAIEIIGPGAPRTHGETCVPLIVWNTNQFKVWWEKHLIVGNTIEDFVIKSIIPNKDKDKAYLYSAHVSMFIHSEGRLKANEWIYSRCDIRTLIPFYQVGNGKVRVFLTREFRLPANNDHAYIYEFASGSSDDNATAEEDARSEFSEEMGIELKEDQKLIPLADRQIFGTFSPACTQVYAVELDDVQSSHLNCSEDNKTVHGADAGERITIHSGELNEVISNHARFPIDMNNLAGLLLLKRYLNYPG